ncbi:Uncharacterized conserved protein, heparinase superfamily [Geoalkalibacter ferrihydriticus]|uniref:Uncharacterized conserved protein, heparinase superfamily n=1 Tax=Geoalkalibacter ferrihydriticus TaxID=392333 RepID=A0A1G9X7L4_9BACT|nr:heparinase II/III family protein [Geoalkalibacter ferrihydriticus]SDM92325.1 Uncharacterized conserved protein, heparinase superfamily [Geoalkalibacter ferrihydriticus]
MVSPGRFRFLNVEYSLESATDWNHPQRPKLWLYNLHYFDDLCATDAAARRDAHLALIRRWIAENPPAVGNGWEPYPISLRVVNWIKWALAGNELPAEALDSLAVQTRYLLKRLEYHLLGNHLWANAKALVFAGLFFAGDEAQAWLSRGLKILDAQMPEQILEDGGHFERSPMYHAIILDDLLDLINLYRAYGREIPVDWLGAHVCMRAWLIAMSHPDGDIALFNDAAFQIAPRWQELDAYAGRLDLARQSYPPDPILRFPETGYIRCEKGPAVLLVDVAPVGPDYLPGHAHADTLNFELSLFGQRVFVDSGTSTYEKTTERERQRGTTAHNTLTVDGENSTEVWGGFRVARRAYPLALTCGMTSKGVFVDCAHDGYRRLPGKVVHRRRWDFVEGRLTLHDRLEGRFGRAQARLHLHPDVQAELVNDDGWRLSLADVHGVAVRVIGAETLRVEQTTWHPAFGVAVPNQCLVAEIGTGELVTQIEWTE